MGNRFDSWEDCKDCNKCSHYWDDSCDGMKPNSVGKCTSFKATRHIDIPEQIAQLKLKLLINYVIIIFLAILTIINYLLVVM